MRPLRLGNGDDSFSPRQIEEMQERLATVERLSTHQQHLLVEQQTEMLRLRAILLAVGRELPDIDGLPTVPLMPAVRPQPSTIPAPSASSAATSAPAEDVSAPSERQPDTATRPQTHPQTSRRALLKWGSAAAAAGVAATAANMLHEAPTANAAGIQWQTGTVSADVETLVKPSSSSYADKDLLQVQLGTGTVFQPTTLNSAITAYDTTGSNIGVYGTSSGGTGLFGVTDTGTAAQGDAGIFAKALSTGTGVAGSSGSGIGVQGNSSTGIGGSFTGGQAPLALGLGTAGAPTTGTHIAGEIYADANATIYVCVQGGTPGVWNKVAWASSLSGGQVNLLKAPIRVLDTRPTMWGANTSHDVQITGVAVNGISVPAGALAMIGNVTVTQTAGSGFLTLFPQGAPLPNTSTINYVGGQTVANAATVGLSSSGKITIHVANQGAYVVLDVAGYIM